MSEYDDLLKPIKYQLILTGLNVMDANWKSTLWTKTSLILLGFLVYGHLMYLVINLGDIEKIQNVAEAGSVLGSVSALFIKAVFLVLKRDEIISFSNEIRQQYTTSRNVHPEITNKYAKHFSSITKMFSCIVYILAMLYIITSLCAYETPQLPLLMKIPLLPLHGWPFFHINYCVQILCMWTGTNVDIAIEVFTVFCIYYVCCRIEILTYMVHHWNENIKYSQGANDERKNDMLLQEIVNYHSSIKRNMDAIISIFSPMIMAGLLSNSIVICMCLIIIIENPVLKIFCHILLALTQTFMYCFLGHILIKENDNLVVKIMLVDFYYLKIPTRKSYMNIVQNACNSIKLQSYSVTVDMTLFIKVLKFAYSVFSLMESKV